MPVCPPADKTVKGTQALTQSFLSFLFAMLAAVSTGGKPSGVRPVELMSQDEMEARVRIDVSRKLKVKFEEVRVIEASDRMWPDQDLGCTQGKDKTEPAPTPGFRIVAQANKQKFIYHTDRAGRVLSCAPAKKKRTNL